MKKNSVFKNSEIRANKKYNTSIKPTSSLLSSAKLRKSVKNKTALPDDEEPSSQKSHKGRKSSKNVTVKSSLKKKSILLNSNKENNLLGKTEKKKTIVGSKKNSLKSEKRVSLVDKDGITSRKSMRVSSSSLKDINSSTRIGKKAKTSVKTNKSAKKSIELPKKTKKKKKEKDNIENSENSNKKDINTISENDPNISNTEDSKIKSKSNQDDEKALKEGTSKSQSKKSSINPERVPININNHYNQDGIPNEYFENKPANVNLIKEINEKPNYRYESNYDINSFMNNQEQEDRIKNYKIESSGYITEKNKNMMRSLLRLLERQPDGKKELKNIFRSSLNNLLNQENNKLLESITRAKNDIFRIAKDVKLKCINEEKAYNRLYDIYKALFEQNNNLKSRYEKSWGTPQSPFLVRQNYFFNYVDNRHPNMDLFLGNNSSNINLNNNRMSYSYDKNYYVMGKNRLKVENRDNKYLSYNYDSMINSLNNRLNKDFREIYRQRKIENLKENINNNIYAMNPMEYFSRKTFS